MEPKKAKGYRLDPISINETAWFYEEPEGVTVVQEDRDATGRHLRTLQTVIPWKLLCASVDRHREQKTPTKRSEGKIQK